MMDSTFAFVGAPTSRIPRQNMLDPWKEIEEINQGDNKLEKGTQSNVNSNKGTTFLELCKLLGDEC